MEIELYFLKREEKTRLYQRSGLDSLAAMGLTVDPENYEMVWHGWISVGPAQKAAERAAEEPCMESLEELYRSSREGLLNLPRPVGTSDIVWTAGETWFRDAFGWERIG